MSLTVTLLELGESLSWRQPRRRYRRSALADDKLREVEAKVRPILEELERLRRETLHSIDGRALLMIPGGLIAGFLVGLLIGQGDDWPVLRGLMYSVLGGGLGWVWAFTSLNNAYRRAYKTRIIPHLAACFGELDYRPAIEPDLKRLARLGLIPGFGKKLVEDEIHGGYRGIPLSIIEAKLETGGKNSSVVFNGLLVGLLFPRGFDGTTIVAKDGGFFGNAVSDFVRSHGLERVRLEDPRFEDRYQVYSSSQIAARALLTPAVMERLMELAIHSEGDPPRLLAEGGRLQVSMAKDKNENLFEPPSIADRVHGSDMLVELSSDIGTVLKLVDAVLGVTPITRANAGQH